MLMVARRSAVDVRRRGARPAPQRDRDRARELRQELRRLPVDELLGRCSRFRRSSSRTPDQLADRPRAPLPRPTHPGGHRRSRELEREILAHVRALAPQLLDEPGVGPIVAAQTDRQLVTPRPRPLRSSLRTPRRRRTAPRLERTHHPPPPQPRRRPPTQPRPPHRHPPPPPARPRNQRLHRPPRRRRQDQPRSHPPAQALPRPPPLPRNQQRGADDDLTVIGASFPSLAHPSAYSLEMDAHTACLQTR